ncbi:hypothetical protein PMIN01_03664 [Paraphaeosphaeria minitans]|uniref:Uncharacterized protein n=1 Tax=Paraphaeosphaeria minitans TaxID=565426 RepID=A0A9P6GMJ2_9PLEO|nr:hypothetical protein PMIN01_03664 [Paraphaeosphaeria minitans]
MPSLKNSILSTMISFRAHLLPHPTLAASTATAARRIEAFAPQRRSTAKICEVKPAGRTLGVVAVLCLERLRVLSWRYACFVGAGDKNCGSGVGPRQGHDASVCISHAAIARAAGPLTLACLEKRRLESQGRGPFRQCVYSTLYEQEQLACRFMAVQF